MANLHNEELKELHKKRLQVLELKAAQYGLDTPPQITTEIEEIQARLRAFETVTALQEESNLLPDRRQDNRLSIMAATVTEVANVKSAVMNEIADLKKVVDKIAEDGKVFQHIMSDSIKAAHYATFEKIRVLERIVIAVIVIVIVWIIVSILQHRGLL